MLLLRFVLKIARLFAAVTIIKLQRPYQEWTPLRIDHDRWPPLDVAQKDLFDGPKARINVVRWGRISSKPHSLESIEWRLLVDLRLLSAGWICDYKRWGAWKLPGQAGAKDRVYELLKPHVGRGLLSKNKKSASRVYLTYKGSRRAAEVLANHNGISLGDFKRAARHNMELRAKAGAKDGLT
jgi:hypothetical protein